MLYLDTATSVLRAVLSSAAGTTQPRAHVWFYDVPNVSKEGFENYKGSVKRTSLNDTTAVDICAAPKEGFNRVVKTISINNRSTDTELITVKSYNATDNTEELIIGPVEVPSLSTLHYEDGAGWYLNLLGSGTGSSSSSTFPFSLLLNENNLFLFEETLTIDGKYVGIGVEGTLGESVAFGECIYLKSDGKWWKAKADSTTTSGPVKVGICVLAGSADAATKILLFGIVRADSLYPTLTKGAAVYISAATAGLITQTAPTTTDHVIRVIGHGWYTGDEMYFNPSPDYSTHT